MKLIKMITAGLIFLVTVVAFQNCSQSGTVTTSNSAQAKATSDSPNDILTIVPPGPVVSDGGNTVPVAMPSPTALPTGEPVPTASPKPYPSGSGGSDVPPTAGSGDDDQQSSGQCRNMTVTDFLLQVKAIQISGGDKNSALTIVDSDPRISLEKPTIKFKSLQKVSVKNLFLVLDSVGNVVMDASGKVADLKTPSAQTSGLKIRLASEVSLDAQKVYLLQLDINPADQIVTNPVKCLFRPVVRQARITSTP